MREGSEIHQANARRGRQAAILRIAGAILVAAILAGCDRCGDPAFPGVTACRQEAPKAR
jgi:hypothetical protein